MRQLTILQTLYAAFVSFLHWLWSTAPNYLSFIILITMLAIIVLCWKLVAMLKKLVVLSVLGFIMLNELFRHHFSHAYCWIFAFIKCEILSCFCFWSTIHREEQNWVCIFKGWCCNDCRDNASGLWICWSVMWVENTSILELSIFQVGCIRRNVAWCNFDFICTGGLSWQSRCCAWRKKWSNVDQMKKYRKTRKLERV